MLWYGNCFLKLSTARERRRRQSHERDMRVNCGSMKKKILIVDDESLIRYSLTVTLKDADREVVPAANGAEALRAISENRFDVCILDIHLPDMSGLDIMKKVRTIQPETKIFIMTGSEVAESMMTSIRENAQLLITKPFDLDEVKSFVDRVISTGSPLCLDGSWEVKKRSPFVTWVAGDNRKNERKSVQKSITYFSVPQAGGKAATVLTADVLDISEAGMRIRTDDRLVPGDFIKIFDRPARCTGVVRWSANADVSDTYHAGIQFLPAEKAVF